MSQDQQLDVPGDIVAAGRRHRPEQTTLTRAASCWGASIPITPQTQDPQVSRAHSKKCAHTRHRGPWVSPGPDSHRLPAVSLSLGVRLGNHLPSRAPELLGAQSHVCHSSRTMFQETGVSPGGRSGSPKSWPPMMGSRSSELEERPGHGPDSRFLCPIQDVLGHVWGSHRCVP
jgi:hypothetical protein